MMKLNLTKDSQVIMNKESVTKPTAFSLHEFLKDVLVIINNSELTDKLRELLLNLPSGEVKFMHAVDENTLFTLEFES